MTLLQDEAPPLPVCPDEAQIVVSVSRAVLLHSDGVSVRVHERITVGFFVSFFFLSSELFFFPRGDTFNVSKLYFNREPSSLLEEYPVHWSCG